MNDALEADGFVAAGRVLDDAQVAAARDAADSLLAEHGAPSDYGVIALEAWRRSPEFHRLLAPLARVACDLLGTDVLVTFQDLLIDKPPTAGTTLPWHQDQAYLPLDRDDGLVAWVALDDADAARGCLRYVPGSHRLGLRGAAEFHGEQRPRDGAGAAPIDANGHPVFVAEASSGEAWFHTPLTWHASPPNRAAASRRAWSVWFVREETRWAPGRAPHPYVLELTPTDGAPLAEDRFPRFERSR
jgi:ectoine hydroxylase-related dioxygenase (phytanoyl-CoA dioxygenase family)